VTSDIGIILNENHGRRIDISIARLGNKFVNMELSGYFA
jgi:hypothetical protein